MLSLRGKVNVTKEGKSYVALAESYIKKGAFIREIMGFLVTTRNDKCSNSHICQDLLLIIWFQPPWKLWSRRYLSHWGFHLHFHGATEQFHLLISFCISSGGKYLFESCRLFFYLCCLLVELQDFIYCGNIPSPCM